VAHVEVVPHQLTQTRRDLVVEQVQPPAALVVGDNEQPVADEHRVHQRRGVVG
jgi:hypothetical protein